MPVLRMKRCELLRLEMSRYQESMSVYPRWMNQNGVIVISATPHGSAYKKREDGVMIA
jgi:hypothetical protein